MPEAVDLKNAVEELISSYETRIGNIGALVDNAFFVFTDFQETIVNAKQEREQVNYQLREALARNEHLRKKDFDSLMRNILQAQEEREGQIKGLLREYFNEQKSMARGLRENLAKFRDSLAKGDVQRVREFQVLIKGILNKQEKRKKEVTSKLKGFQGEQYYLSSKFKELLSKGNALRIKDFKLMLKEIKAKREERLALQGRRKEGVAKMLAGFKKKRKSPASLQGAVNIDKLKPKENTPHS